MKITLAAKILKFTLFASFVLVVIALATLPFLLNQYMVLFYDVYSVKKEYWYFICAFLIVEGLLGLWVLYELIRLINSIPSNPFTRKNVDGIKRIGFIAMAMAALFFAKCFVYFTILTFGCGFVLIICGLCAFTLSNLFSQAVAYKEENDLTV